MKNTKLIIAIGICIIVTFVISLTVCFQVGHNCGYSEGFESGKNHVIYEQEISNTDGGFTVVIDGDKHIYQ